MSGTTQSEGSTPPTSRQPQPAPGTAGHLVLVYARRQVRALRDLRDPARAGDPDAVHRMRVASRRLRSCLRTHRTVLDREYTRGVEQGLRVLAAELGAERDREVLRRRLLAHLGELPPELVRGPIERRIREYTGTDTGADTAIDPTGHTDTDTVAEPGQPGQSVEGGGPVSSVAVAGSFDLVARVPAPADPAGDPADDPASAPDRPRAVPALDPHRHGALLDDLTALLENPPLLPDARRPARPVLARALRRERERCAGLLATARRVPDGPDRDAAWHRARRAAKRARYAAEAAEPALGPVARAEATGFRRLQELLDDRQDGVLARAALLDLARRAEEAGESAFTHGVLHGRETARAREVERAVGVVEGASDPLPARGPVR
ncbi:CHAD domain-containing protein [Streptomyces sp. ST2-7A]|uniref:CHAD domain-containing protein n=1 Tax=Streptomyces sp. ST2-7A TaxID=2907214 RepID=UPI001F296C2D|nr:CHAD domain-containing protein [Streptomyces sp. ST2-7A]MCE7079219.1 CHAD domain-containing protein [Streptomyces sp. ST2-7A]